MSYQEAPKDPGSPSCSVEHRETKAEQGNRPCHLPQGGGFHCWCFVVEFVFVSEVGWVVVAYIIDVSRFFLVQ